MSLHDDPRLTAYALGELDAAETTEFEALLANDPAAQAEVDAIRSMAALLEGELSTEADAPVDEALRADVLAGPSKSRGWMLWASGLATAAAAVGLFVMSANDEPQGDSPSARILPKSAASAALTPRFEDGPAKPGSIEAKRRARMRRALRKISRDMPGQLDTAPVAMPATAAPMSVAYAAPRSAAYRKLTTIAGEDLAAKSPGIRPGEVRDPRSVQAPIGRRSKRSQRELDALIDGVNKAHYAQKPETTSTAAPRNRAFALDANLFRMDDSLAKRAGVAVPAAPATRVARPMQLAVAKEEAKTQIAAGLLGRGDRVNADPSGRDQFIAPPENPFTQPTLEPLSTFSIDVDTASYSMVRSRLNQGRRPNPASVRIEELMNYFDYDYAPPVDGQPFATHVEVASAPWAPAHRLVRVGLKGKMVDRPRANLVFLLDVSGSMSARNKLPLLKDAMSTLVDNLHPDDRVAIVVYAGASGLVLDSTPAKNKRAILGALERLKSGGGTNGGAGIQQAYWVAARNFVQGGVNRVIIGTDGDFNVGTTSRHALVEMVEQRAQGGIALTVLGFGMGGSGGGYNDATLEQLADKGDGNYAFIDTASEARKVLVDQLDGTLVTIAKDVKIQVEFNPARVAAYRLIGYENRCLAAQDFNDDTKDAGEIGAGHAVTALYEVIPTGVAGGRTVDPLKYQRPKPIDPTSREMLTLKLRYQPPTGGKSTLISGAVIDDGVQFDAASADLRFAASVAAFGMLLRGSPHAGSATMDAVLGWAGDALGKDEWRYRQGFLDLVRKARRLR